MSESLTSLAGHFHDYLKRELDGIPTGGDRSNELIWTVANLHGVAIGLAQVLDHVAAGLTAPADITHHVTAKLQELEELNRTLTELSHHSASSQATQLANANGRTAAYTAVLGRFTSNTTDETTHPGAHHHVSCGSVDDMAKVCAALTAEGLPFSLSVHLKRPS